MIDTEIYYALASRQMRKSVQQMASSLLKVHKLKGRMWYICEIARKLVDEKVMSLDDVLDRKGIEWEAPPMTIRQRKNDQVGGADAHMDRGIKARAALWHMHLRYTSEYANINK